MPRSAAGWSSSVNPSPRAYRADPWFRARLDAFCVDWSPLDRVRAHYLHLGLRQRARVVDGDGTAPVKKLFYLLRPALALRWMRANDGLPPMHLNALVAACDLPSALRRLVDELVRRKSTTRELGREPLPADLLAFADAELALARDAPVDTADPAEARQAADALFREVVARCGK